MLKQVLLVAALAGLAPGLLAQEAAQRLAAPCAVCHGTDGRAATNDLVPLAGLPREHIAGQLRAFRDGQRPATVMHQIAKGYSDAQIDALAAWFASQKRQGGK
jgi:cytochrome subunit of sulfide dehydrogenase